MKRARVTTVQTLEAWRCRQCGYLYEVEEYPLPVLRCPQCNSPHSFDRVTEEREYHPSDDLMLLP